jgi:hypothetical protein
MDSEHNNFNKHSGNYGAFNNNRNKKKQRKDGQEINKTININHYHLGSKNSRPTIDCIENEKEKMAKEIVEKFSLDKPVIGNQHDRYTPNPVMKSNNGSPTNFLEPDRVKFIHVIHPDMKMNEILLNRLKEESNNNDLKEKVLEKEQEDMFEEIIIPNEINHIKDLIDLSVKYVVKPKTRYSIDLIKLNNIVPHLNELNTMIGMEDVKKSITHQLKYFLQGFDFKHMLHTIIEGPPGVGKTCLGKILGQIYLNLGCIKTDNLPSTNEDDEDSQLNIRKLFSNMLNVEKPQKETKKFKFKIAKRSDLVGQYVGHTAVKTQKIINESFGGVLFIDEAYSLGGDDVFSKECINTINQNLSENGDKFICIIAGYSDALENSFFSQNSGLHRRFPFRYKIDKYSGEELGKILTNKITKENYTIDSSFSNLSKFIESNMKYFPNFGGDIETYFFHLKIMHSTRVFGKSIKLRNIFTNEDFINALDQMKMNGKKEDKKPDFYT